MHSRARCGRSRAAARRRYRSRPSRPSSVVEVLLAVLLPLGIIILAIGSSARGGVKRRDVLAELATRLSGTSESNTVTGTCRGVRVQYRLETRGSGSSSESWTEIDAEV